MQAIQYVTLMKGPIIPNGIFNHRLRIMVLYSFTFHQLQYTKSNCFVNVYVPLLRGIKLVFND